MNGSRFPVIKNPRKENGDLGDKECSLCLKKSGAYVLICGMRVCKGCLTKAIDRINKAILDF